MQHCYYDKTFKVCLKQLATTTTTTAQANVITETLPVPQNEPGAQASTQAASTMANMKGFLYFGMKDPWAVEVPDTSVNDESLDYDLTGAGNEEKMVTLPVYDETFNVPGATCSGSTCNYQRNGLL